MARGWGCAEKAPTAEAGRSSWHFGGPLPRLLGVFPALKSDRTTEVSEMLMSRSEVLDKLRVPSAPSDNGE